MSLACLSAVSWLSSWASVLLDEDESQFGDVEHDPVPPDDSLVGACREGLEGTWETPGPDDS